MKKLLKLLFFGIIISQSIRGQVIAELPTNESGKLNYNDIVKTDSIVKQELYSNAKLFFANKFKSANDVIQLDDKENTIIVGKGYNDIFIKSKTSSFKTQLWFTIKIQCKDGRYKYEIYDLYFKSYPIGNYPSTVTNAEEIFDIHYFDKVAKLNEKQTTAMKEQVELYKAEMIACVNGLIVSIKTDMSNRNKNDW